MRITTKIVLLIDTGEIIHRESFEYQGPVSLAIGGSGGKTKQTSRSQQQSQAGYAFNEPLLATLFGKSKTTGGVQAYGDDYEAGVFGYEPTAQGKFVTPAYTPADYTGGRFTQVAPEGFNRLEQNLYGGQASKLSQAYNQAVNRQREELSQAGALNSPTQYLAGGVREPLDRSYLEGSQQAARDAALARLGLEEREAGRRTEFDVGQGMQRTAFDVGEATRQTGFGEREAGRETDFNVKQADDIWKRFMAKLAVALEASKYSTASGWGSGESNSLQGSGSIFGGSSGGGGEGAAGMFSSLMALF